MPADVVNRFIAAIEQHDLPAALALVTDDCEYDNVPIGKVHGPQGVQQVLGPFLDGFEEVEWVVRQQVASGTADDGIVMNERLDRFRRGDRWVELPVAGLFVVRGGRIALWRDYFDLATLTRETAPGS